MIHNKQDHSIVIINLIVPPWVGGGALLQFLYTVVRLCVLSAHPTERSLALKNESFCKENSTKSGQIMTLQIRIWRFERYFTLQVHEKSIVSSKTVIFSRILPFHKTKCSQT